MWSFGTTMTMANDDQDRRQPAIPAPQASATQDIPAVETARPVSTRPDTRTPILSQRSLSQLGLFAAGAGFLAFSTLITRRAIARKHIVGLPLFFEQSNRPASKIGSDGGLVAVEALGLATLNTICFGVMATGGLSWAFDISTVAELRETARKHTLGGMGELDEAAEKEIAKYFSDIMAGKDQKDGKPSLTEAVTTLMRQQQDQKDGQQSGTKTPGSKDT
ncbi:hypothetical protein SUNI508_01008 [Seiridium unicorne]|uniref:Altered inheritance of mitochondria protein 11 n=1 Tax=Seiridium unicorne TaxID=138068 RepID=A0ABR2V1X6_9PEZI